ncbi:MAG: DNA-3-methyladenine glycosylase I [Bacteroidetes bacterium]|nr:DNA-3-methyladenine glycosylase I [Bacteroidota bacterium]
MTNVKSKLPTSHTNQKDRCPWSESTEKMMHYHDTEWGVPVHDDTLLFEYIVLDTFQAGLSWSTVLNKRENFRKAFDDFDYKKVSRYSEKKIQKLLTDEGIIRNKLKIYGTVNNAQRFLDVQKEFKTFDAYIWQFTGGKVIKNKWKDQKQIPARSEHSDAMSKNLYDRGFKFVGSTICYAFMQAAGMINDHLVSCHRYGKYN